MSDINTALEGIKTEIKSAQNELLETVKQNNKDRDVVLEAKMTTLNERIDTLQAQLVEAAAAAQRPGNATVANEGSEEFRNFVRTGMETRAGQASVNTGTGAAGGFAVPSFLDSNIVQTAQHISPLFNAVSLLKTSTPDTSFLVNRNGTSLDWVSTETGTNGMRDATLTPEMAKVTVPFGHLFGKHLISNYALNDVNFNPEAEVQDGIGREIGAKVGQAILLGSGSAQPKGILAYATAATGDAARAFGTIEHVASGTASSIGADAKTALQKLYALIYAMKPQHRQRSSFVMNRLTIAQYRGLVDNNGQPLWQPSNIAGQPATLAGYPVIECEDVPVVGAGSLSVIFGDLSAYRIYDLVGMTMLRDPYSYDAFVALKTNKRLGGCLADTEAVKVLKCAVS